MFYIDGAVDYPETNISFFPLSDFGNGLLSEAVTGPEEGECSVALVSG